MGQPFDERNDMHRLCARKLDVLKHLNMDACLYAPKVQELIDRWTQMDAASTLPDMDDLFKLMHETQRMEWVVAFGLQYQPYFVDAQLALAGGAWQGKEAFVPPSNMLAERLARRLVDGVSLSPQDHPQLMGSYYGKEILYQLAEHFLKQDMDFDVDFPEAYLKQSFALQATPEMNKGYGEWLRAQAARVTKLIAVRSNQVEEAPTYLDDTAKKEAGKKLSAATKEIVQNLNRRRMEALAPDYMPWTLTYLPTADEAALDGMDYGAYKKMFFEACDQPWPEIQEAQQKLIDAFDRGRDVRITNSDGTDISFSIEGHSFANSGAIRNIPGAEFFSSPNKTSVNGTIVAKGTFFEKKDHMVVKDMVLTVKDGRIESWNAAEAKDALDKAFMAGDNLPADDPKFEGNRYFGEIGFGTNPHLNRHLSNGLLVEKISGSFHMAVGSAYLDGYLGKPVKLDNGNRGVDDFHWDVTTMLKGKDGQIFLDGHLMQKNGVWQAVPALGITEADVEVLNHGWAALPEFKRPGWFKDQNPQIQAAAGR